MTAPRPSDVRFKVEPGDISPEKAARRLHLTVDRFHELLPRLLARGFPPPDPDTGNFDLDAMDRWRQLRNAALFGLTPSQPAEQPAAKSTMGERFREAQERKRHSPAA